LLVAGSRTLRFFSLDCFFRYRESAGYYGYIRESA